MSCLRYERMCCDHDGDISRLISIFQIPEISRYYSIDSKNYFFYVTNTEDVYFYKVYDSAELVGVTHLEKQESTLYMSVMVLPEFQRTGIGTKIVKAIINDSLGPDYDRIEVFIDENNTASKKLFENLGFAAVSKDEELINYVFEKE